jgi:radical SAM superfamily enzyme YgiQ (UPF0313 family)
VTKVKLVYAPAGERFHPLPPLGIAILTAALRNSDIYVDQVDLELLCWMNNWRTESDTQRLDLRLLTDYSRVKEHILQKPDSDLQREIAKCFNLTEFGDFDIVGFSIMGYRQFVSSLCLASEVKKRAKSMVVFGGSFVSSRARSILERFSLVDFIIIGDAWASLPNLCLNLDERQDLQTEKLNDVQGLAYRSSNEVVIIPPMGNSIKSMPCPDYDYLPIDLYRDQLNIVYKHQFDMLILQYLVGKGCARRCSFCGRPRLAKLEMIPFKKIVADLKSLSKRYGTRCFCIECNEINPTCSWAKDFSRALITNHVDIEWYAYALPANLDHNTLDQMFKAGCRMLRFGVESGSPKIVQSMRKGFTVDECQRVLKNSHDVGIWNHVNFILGYPGENERDIDQTKDFFLRNAENIDSVRINPYILHKDSIIYENPDKYGIRIIGEDLDQAIFDEIGGLNWEQKRQLTLRGIHELVQAFQSKDVQFGISYNLLFCSIVHFQDRGEAKRWMKQNHKYLFESLPFQAVRWKIYHRNEEPPFPLDWNYFVGKALGYYAKV